MPTPVQKPPRKSLTDRLTTALRDKISGGSLQAGDKLPSENKLAEQFGVSRTVVREAIAGLRADGLVEARQGAGMFVLTQTESLDRGRPWPAAPDTLSTIIETLELRTAVEKEAASLAATRCSPGQEAKIIECYEAMAANVERNLRNEEADFLFHRAVAEATNNSQFTDFLEFLGRRTIPRAQFQPADEDALTAAARERELLAEHWDIVTAVCDRDPAAARDAMQRHLRGSLQRYRQLRVNWTAAQPETG